MRDLYLKRNELCNVSKKLKVAKWKTDITKTQVTLLIKKQDEIYKKYKFYDNYLKKRGEIK